MKEQEHKAMALLIAAVVDHWTREDRAHNSPEDIKFEVPWIEAACNLNAVVEIMNREDEEPN